MTKEEMKNEEWYVIFNMNCKYEICRMCPKSGLFKGSHEECEKWIKQKKKEEKKDEMKNRISMTLKDPTLQQGFEVICKNLVELEKENAELKDYRLTTLAKQQTGMSKYALNLEHKLSWYDDQLTKAKEIIKAFLDSSDLNIKHKAEEFLGEF